MCYAVGISSNICACNLTSELAGRKRKYYAIPYWELPHHPNIAQQTFSITHLFLPVVLDGGGWIDWCVLFVLSTELK